MTQVSLDDVLRQRVALHWSQAVAIIGELCTVLVRDGGSDAPIPNPIEILLSADGAVMIRPDARAAAPSTTPGHLLNALLALSDPPAPVRLFASVAATSDRYNSVGAFGEALSYYELPGRTPLVQAAYQAAIAPPAPSVDPTATPPREPEHRKLPDKKARRAVPVWALAAGAAALGVVVAATLWISSDSRPASPAAVATGDGEAAAAAGDVPATEQPGNIAANADAPGSARDLRRGSPPPGSRARSSAARGPVVRLTDKAGYPLDAGAAATGVATTTPPAGDADAIFSNASSDVRPPVAITPLPVTGRNPNFESTATLELLVDEKGTVAGVKLLSQPTQIQPLMLLSAAKTWMFRPALRDGRPVKYRLRVDVPATTR